MNFNGALIMWGENTGQLDIRDIGIYMHASEAAGTFRDRIVVSDG